VKGLPRPARRFNAAVLWSLAIEAQRAPSAAGSGEIVRGIPACPGVHRGPVRIVRGEADFGRVLPGDVLVCHNTDPAWAVLFGTAGGLVTDAGGVLSHAAIVAREHAIPAVLGTGDATTVLVDGEIVVVDGGSGTVSREVE
jgi:pyruvate,water dikinase